MVELKRLFTHVRERDLGWLGSQKQRPPTTPGRDEHLFIRDSDASSLAELASRLAERAPTRSATERFAAALALAWQEMGRSPEVFLVAHLAANAVATDPTFPIVSLRAWDRPFCAIAVDRALCGDASALFCLVASRVTELCSFVSASTPADEAKSQSDA